MTPQGHDATQDWSYKRGLTERDGSNTPVGHAATIGLFVALGTAFLWVPIALTAIGIAAMLALPAGILFCIIAAPIGFYRARKAAERKGGR
jgi:hypothetical protein